MAKTKTTKNADVDVLLKQLLTMARLLTRTMDESAAQATTEPLRESKMRILAFLAEGDQNSTRIAQHLGVSKPAVTQLVDSLVRRKLVQRTLNKQDRRESKVSLSAKGKSVLDKIQVQQRQLLSGVLASKSQGAQWATVATQITDALSVESEDE